MLTFLLTEELPGKNLSTKSVDSIGGHFYQVLVNDQLTVLGWMKEHQRRNVVVLFEYSLHPCIIMWINSYYTQK